MNQVLTTRDQRVPQYSLIPFWPSKHDYILSTQGSLLINESSVWWPVGINTTTYCQQGWSSVQHSYWHSEPLSAPQVKKTPFSENSPRFPLRDKPWPFLDRATNKFGRFSSKGIVIIGIRAPHLMTTSSKRKELTLHYEKETMNKTSIVSVSMLCLLFFSRRTDQRFPCSGNNVGPLNEGWPNPLFSLSKQCLDSPPMQGNLRERSRKGTKRLFHSKCKRHQEHQGWTHYSISRIALDILCKLCRRFTIECLTMSD